MREKKGEGSIGDIAKKMSEGNLFDTKDKRFFLHMDPNEANYNGTFTNDPEWSYQWKPNPVEGKVEIEEQKESFEDDWVMVERAGPGTVRMPQPPPSNAQTLRLTRAPP